MKSLRLLLPVLVLIGCSTGEADEASDVDARLNDMARSALAQLDGDIRVAGLANEVEVIRDAAGIAHIYASNQEDLFFAQGFVAVKGPATEETEVGGVPIIPVEIVVNFFEELKERVGN